MNDSERGRTPMEIFSGTGNWKLTVSKTENSVTVLRACTCDAHAVFPETLFGLPVTTIGPRCFAPGAAAAEGESAEIVCGVPEGEYDNKNLVSLSLPASLREIGSYAFMNCRRLETLSLFDNVENTGAGIFMNCRELKSIDLKRLRPEQGTFLALAVSSLACALDVTVTDCGGNIMRLVFPEYYEIQTENGPTHFFNYNIEGGGYPYHHVFEKRTLKTEAYDALWPDYIYRGFDGPTALRLAWRRLRDPYELSYAARERYEAYLKKHLSGALELVLREKDTDGLRFLLRMPELSAEELAGAQTLARERAMTEAVALLLEKQHEKFGSGRRKKYDL